MRHEPRESTQALEPLARIEPLDAIVRVRRGGLELGSHRLGLGACLLGAGSDSDFVVDDPSVSRKHLTIELVPEGVRVRDLGSRNGTFFAGQRFTEMTLSLGSSVTVGTTEISFEADLEAFEGTRGARLVRYGDLYGESADMQRLFTLMKRLEGSLVNVLVEGESGTGKELVARALHEHSQVRGGPWIALNCGAVDRTLIRSELFGHKKGAFTGAVNDSRGALGEADGGTLFLDEIGELPLDVQPVLLRVLESGVYTRVGETKERPVKLRVISATNRNLEEEVLAGKFRRDLYYRLMVVRLPIEPLRRRRADLPGLIRFLTERLDLPPLPDAVRKELEARSFPGNVRELKHALLAYAAVGELPLESGALAAAGAIGLDAELEAFADPARPYSELKDELTERMTRIYLARLLERTSGNLSEASRVSGLQRGYLRSLCERFDLRGSPRDPQK